MLALRQRHDALGLEVCISQRARKMYQLRDDFSAAVLLLSDTGATPSNVPSVAAVFLLSDIEGQLLDGHVHRIPAVFDFDDDPSPPVTAVIENAWILVGEVISVVYPLLLADPDVGVVYELGDDRAVELAPLVLEPSRHDLEELLAAVEKDAENGGDDEHAEDEE